jgi:hypothetical protein
MLQCGWVNDTAFRNTQIKQLQALLNDKHSRDTNTPVITIILDSIDAWMTNANAPDYDHLLDHPNPYLHAAAATQEIIGWDNFLKARLSKAWTNFHSHEATSRSPQSTKNWIQKLSKWSWNLFSDSWKSRNTLIFGENDENTRAIKLSQLEPQVRKAFVDCNDLPDTHKHHHQYQSIEEILQRPISTISLWLTQAEQTLTEHRKAKSRGFPQTLITRFFLPVIPPPVT